MEKRNLRPTACATLLAGVMVAALSGCGTPGAPLPPSLDLPQKVTDLSADRVGDLVTLHWTMPRRNTDKLLLKNNVTVNICRQSASSLCEPVGGDRLIAPGREGSFSETLPVALKVGDARPAKYFVELKNSRGRSAGLSNGAVILAGSAPDPVEGFSADVRRDGVVLRWKNGNANALIRLERTLQSPPVAKAKSLLSEPEEAVQQILWVDAADAKAHRALDSSARFGEIYSYRVQQVIRRTFGGIPVELAGQFSAPVQVEVRDEFPPSVPAGLVAVAVSGEKSIFIDLNWQPVVDSHLAGYLVWRSEDGGSWQRLTRQSGIAPAFHDTTVRAGHTYRYAVSSVSRSGHASARSEAASESVPEQ